MERYDLVLSVLMGNLDDLFLTLMGSLILLMQAGFAFLEAGSVWAKNTTNILIKNFADLCFGESITRIMINMMYLLLLLSLFSYIAGYNNTYAEQ